MKADLGVTMLGALLAAAGCAPTTAIVNGREVPRLDLAFTGRPYSVRHSGAHPAARSPSNGLSDDGGHISGHVCGLDLLYDVRHAGDRVRLTGFIDANYPATVEVRDAGGSRLFAGSLGSSAGLSMIELRLDAQGLVGRVGFRAFVLHQEGDRLVGKMRINDTRWADVRVEGRDALWSMPAADQAAILPAILTCYGRRIERDVRNPLEVRIGGEAGAEPAGTSSLYLGSTRF